MHKLILKGFDLSKNLLQFIKIFMFFSILMLMFYWIENIINSNWDWLSFIKPYLAFFVNIGKSISNDSINVFGAVFEYKYFIAAVLFLIINVFAELLIRFVDWSKDVYGDGRLLVKKIEENAFNKNLEKNNINEQKQVKNYLVYVSTSIKKRYDYNGSGVNLEEQNKIMLKFLMDKTGIVPEKFENGYLFSFNDFNNIDKTLDIFYKLITSDAPLDYVICVQMIDKNYIKQREQLKHLINLKFSNKISTFADTIWRYSYNSIKKYKTSQLGVFQKGETTYEAHEFELIQ